jgi:dihydrolipoamide dehydrogenase
VALLQQRLTAEGVELHTDAEADGVTVDGEDKVVHAGEVEARGRTVVVATGRRPDVDELGLEALGVDVTPASVVVDDRDRTAVKSIYTVTTSTFGISTCRRRTERAPTPSTAPS